MKIESIINPLVLWDGKDNEDRKKQLIWLLTNWKLYHDNGKLDKLKTWALNTEAKLRIENDERNLAVKAAAIALSKVPLVGSSLGALVNLAQEDPYEIAKNAIAVGTLQDNRYGWSTSYKPIIKDFKTFPVDTVRTENNKWKTILVAHSNIIAMEELMVKVKSILQKQKNIVDVFIVGMAENLMTNFDLKTEVLKMIKEEYSKLKVKEIDEIPSNWEKRKPVSSLLDLRS